ncbi:serine hydrolase domain-containing protein [Niallia sp.]|uniref:serine hydrolase domain-containing protein n=1 Tax=Niallia sp. TaxID=2837523 RepID=UPI0028968D99|nr:serine hydrolase domain-containing protein [Niallia sp.]
MKKFFLGLSLFLFLTLSFSETSSAKENTTPSGMPLENMEAFIDEYVKDYIGETAAGAIVIITKDDHILLSKGYGYADINKKTQMNPNTSILEWGSISKLFVWVSVMQMAEQGKIDLEEDIRRYLPEKLLTKLTFDEPITMLHLMNHNAGFEDSIFDLGYSSKEQVKSLEEGLKIAEPKQIYKPGEVVAYSNYSTSLAAYIVERVSGQKFDEYVSSNILSKLEMNHTTPHISIEKNQDFFQNKTKGYELGEPKTFLLSNPFYMSLYPSGEMNGTAEDLAKFAMALMPENSQGSLLFKNIDTLTNLLSQSYAPTENAPGIAHGFWEYDGNKRGLLHGGNTASFSSMVHIVPEERFGVIILTNQAGESNLTYGLTKELVGKKELTSSKKLPSAKATEGTYIYARKMDSTFIKMYYYYFTQLKIKAVSNNEMELNVGGITANYIQTEPYVYKYKDGNELFLAMDTLSFQIKDDKIHKISTLYTDFLPSDKSKVWLTTSAALLLYCMIFFLSSSTFCIIHLISNWRKKRQTLRIKKWNSLLNFSGIALIINVVILAIRMLINSNRAYSEVFVQIVANYCLTFISLLTIIFIIFDWKKAVIHTKEKFFYLLSVCSMMILIVLLITWNFYH